MAATSTLLAVPSSSTMKSYRIEKVPATVDTNKFAYGKKAIELYNALIKDYDSLIYYLDSIIRQLAKGSGYVKGPIQNVYKKTETYCRRQKEYCYTRKRQLVEAKHNSESEANGRILEEKFGIKLYY